VYYYSLCRIVQCIVVKWVRLQRLGEIIIHHTLIVRVFQGNRTVYSFVYNDIIINACTYLHISLVSCDVCDVQCVRSWRMNKRAETSPHTINCNMEKDPDSVTQCLCSRWVRLTKLQEPQILAMLMAYNNILHDIRVYRIIFSSPYNEWNINYLQLIRRSSLLKATGGNMTLRVLYNNNGPRCNGREPIDDFDGNVIISYCTRAVCSVPTGTQKQKRHSSQTVMLYVSLIAQEAIDDVR